MTTYICLVRVILGDDAFLRFAEVEALSVEDASCKAEAKVAEKEESKPDCAACVGALYVIDGEIVHERWEKINATA